MLACSPSDIGTEARLPQAADDARVGFTATAAPAPIKCWTQIYILFKGDLKTMETSNKARYKA